MKTIKKFVDFVNEKRNIDLYDIETMKTGDVIIAKEDINSDDIDFKKTANNWWGRNIYAAKGILFKKGDVLFISVKGNEGFVGGHDIDDKEYYISSYYWGIDDESFRHELITLALNKGLVEIVKYDTIENTENIKKFKTSLKFNRIYNIIRGGVVYFRDIMEVNSIDVKKGKITITGTDIETNKVIDSYIIKFDSLLDEKFITEDGTVINGEPFDKEQNVDKIKLDKTGWNAPIKDNKW